MNHDREHGLPVHQSEEISCKPDLADSWWDLLCDTHTAWVNNAWLIASRTDFSFIYWTIQTLALLCLPPPEFSTTSLSHLNIINYFHAGNMKKNLWKETLGRGQCMQCFVRGIWYERDQYGSDKVFPGRVLLLCCVLLRVKTFGPLGCDFSINLRLCLADHIWNPG